jgi:hypothetical protein
LVPLLIYFKPNKFPISVWRTWLSDREESFLDAYGCNTGLKKIDFKKQG